MFMVFSKEKISSYTILLSTVIILFGCTVIFNKQDVAQTSTNIEKTNRIRANIEKNANYIYED